MDVDRYLARIGYDGPRERHRFLVDVGFGDSALAPLIEHDERAPDTVEMFEGGNEGAWGRQLRVDLTPRQLADFEPRSTFLQTEPGLQWTTKRFATRATDGGRVWLFADRLKQRVDGGATTETPIAPDEWDAALWEHFAMRLP